jgi:hypothetical protein
MLFNKDNIMKSTLELKTEYLKKLNSDMEKAIHKKERILNKSKKDISLLQQSYNDGLILEKIVDIGNRILQLHKPNMTPKEKHRYKFLIHHYEELVKNYQSLEDKGKSKTFIYQQTKKPQSNIKVDKLRGMVTRE